MTRRYQRLKNFVLTLIVINILAVVGAPLLRLRLFDLSESFSTSLIITILFIFLALLLGIYFKEVEKYKKTQEDLEERLRETFRYIGSINLQLEEMKKVFSNFNKYPESQKDIQAVFTHTAERILAIVPTDWVLLRIMELDQGKTLHEYFLSRGNKKIEKFKLENQDLLNGECSIEGCSIITSQQNNFNLKAFCILSTEVKDKNQQFMITSAINQLEMLFIIFNSYYYKKPTIK
ncbi:MAG: hypothetical protein ACOX6C_00490 [Patescibacteria group bacterium]|jgi:hypothetical protein